MPFLTGMSKIREKRTMFAAEVRSTILPLSITSNKSMSLQLKIKSETKYYHEGSIIADSREPAPGLLVITSGFVNVELPMDSEEADQENKRNGKTLLFVLGRGYVLNI